MMKRKRWREITVTLSVPTGDLCTRWDESWRCPALRMRELGEEAPHAFCLNIGGKRYSLPECGVRFNPLAGEDGVRKDPRCQAAKGPAK